MQFVDEDACLNTGVLVHKLSCLFKRCVEDADAGEVAVIGDRADNRQQTVRAQGKISASVFPDDCVGALLLLVWSSLQDHQAVLPGLGQLRVHKFIGNGSHRLLLPKIALSKVSFSLKTTIVEERAQVLNPFLVYSAQASAFQPQAPCPAPRNVLPTSVSSAEPRFQIGTAFAD